MTSSKSNLALWVLQVLLALFFGLASGLPKFLIPLDQLPMPVPLSQTFVWFIGTCEVLGALGLLLPGITRVGRGLTPVAAVCLVALTVCAAAAQLMGGNPGNAGFALAIGALAAAVAYGRRRLLPSRPAAVAAG